MHAHRLDLVEAEATMAGDLERTRVLGRDPLVAEPDRAIDREPRIAHPAHAFVPLGRHAVVGEPDQVVGRQLACAREIGQAVDELRSHAVLCEPHEIAGADVLQRAAPDVPRVFGRDAVVGERDQVARRKPAESRRFEAGDG